MYSYILVAVSLPTCSTSCTFSYCSSDRLSTLVGPVSHLRDLETVISGAARYTSAYITGNCSTGKMLFFFLLVHSYLLLFDGRMLYNLKIFFNWSTILSMMLYRVFHWFSKLVCFSTKRKKCSNLFLFSCFYFLDFRHLEDITVCKCQIVI